MSLHPRLQEDSHVLGQSSVGTLLLHKNASLPWFILVPETAAQALYQIEEKHRVLVIAQWNQLAAWVDTRFDCERVNMAAIGNVVPQLHLHVVGRRTDDPCWPGVVWGAPLPEVQWKKSELALFTKELAVVISLS